jgi:hypothetical protein
MSAAVDGMKTAAAVIENFTTFRARKRYNRVKTFFIFLEGIS